MTDEEKYFRDVMKKTVRNTVQTLLRTEELAKRFLIRTDVKDIDKEIDRISDEVMDMFMSKLKEGGYLEGSKELSQKQFESLFKSVIDEYFGDKSENRSTAR
jgi:hypothetical protein